MSMEPDAVVMSYRDLRDVIENARVLERESIAVMLDKLAQIARTAEASHRAHSLDGDFVAYSDAERQATRASTLLEIAAAVRARGRT